MNHPVVILDSGVIDRVAHDHVLRSTIRDLVEGGWDLVIPTVVLAEATTGRPSDARANRAIKQIGTVDTSPPTARLAGRLRHAVIRSGARRPPGGIDAIVAAHAAEAGTGLVLTTDPADMRRLLADRPHILVEKP